MQPVLTSGFWFVPEFRMAGYAGYVGCEFPNMGKMYPSVSCTDVMVVRMLIGSQIMEKPSWEIPTINITSGG